jgi:LacI family transcriptional regulator
MNLEDIAKLSGVSRSTVSRVVNHDPNVRTATRERVLQIINDVGYRPNIAARGLAAGRNQIIGLVIPEAVSTIFADPYFPQLIQGVTAVCNAMDHMLVLWLADQLYERQMVHQMLSGGLISGVVLAAAMVREPTMEELLSSRLPFVMIGRHPRLGDISYVDVDNVGGAEKAVRHLWQLGRERIGTISGPKNSVAGWDRLMGYRNALAETGVDAEQAKALEVEGDFTQIGGYRAMEMLLQQSVDAVFVASDIMAAGAIQAINDAGRQVPKDIALVGFDDAPVAARLKPALTTVHQPTEYTGMVAAEMLINAIQNPDVAPQHRILPTELVVRASCGGLA